MSNLGCTLNKCLANMLFYSTEQCLTVHSAWDRPEGRHGAACMQGSPSAMQDVPLAAGAVLHSPFADAPPRLGQNLGKAAGKQHPGGLFVQVRRPLYLARGSSMRLCIRFTT